MGCLKVETFPHRVISSVVVKHALLGLRFGSLYSGSIYGMTAFDYHTKEVIKGIRRATLLRSWRRFLMPTKDLKD
ncbi:hypothetical protein WN943_008406 [Citrus x changshan-huyou]